MTPEEAEHLLCDNPVNAREALRQMAGRLAAMEAVMNQACDQRDAATARVAELEAKPTVSLGEVLFAFESEIIWVNKAKSWYATSGVPFHRTLALDAKGRVCVSGREFMRATSEDAYPIVVYEIL